MSITIALEVHKSHWQTSNHRLHRMDEARRTKHVRGHARLLARSLEPLTGLQAIIATIGYPTARRADAPNAWPVVKAAIDGIVDAGKLPDDSSAYVDLTAFRRGPHTRKSGIYRVELALIPDHCGPLCPFAGCTTCPHPGGVA